MNYNLMAIRYFVDVVQTQGFSSASKRNFVSETAISKAISKLEKELGHRLLNRSNRSLGHVTTTEYGQTFYEQAIITLNDYKDLWNLPKFSKKILKVHFLQSFEDDTSLLVDKLGDSYQYQFDEETFSDCIPRLIYGNYDLLIGYELAFNNNAKLTIFPLRTISFDILMNKQELARYDNDVKKMTANSTLYLQNWQSTGTPDIQTAMLKNYMADGSSYNKVELINSFESSAIQVNYGGGFSLVPERFVVPVTCKNIVRITPDQLKDKFKIVAVLVKGQHEDLAQKLRH